MKQLDHNYRTSKLGSYLGLKMEVGDIIDLI